MMRENSVIDEFAVISYPGCLLIQLADLDLQGPRRNPNQYTIHRSSCDEFHQGNSLFALE